MRVRPTLADVRAELSRGGIVEAEIRDPKAHLSGYCDQPSGVVVINPKPELAKTICHELIHRLHPRLSEARVEEETTRILTHMSDDDVADLCRRYRRRAHRLRRRVEFSAPPPALAS